jgi:hypothetical protein
MGGSKTIGAVEGTVDGFVVGPAARVNEIAKISMSAIAVVVVSRRSFEDLIMG